MALPIRDKMASGRRDMVDVVSRRNDHLGLLFSSQRSSRYEVFRSHTIQDGGLVVLSS